MEIRDFTDGGAAVPGGRTGRGSPAGRWLALALLAWATTGCADGEQPPSCRETFGFGDTGAYRIDESGLVFDSRTGLTWFACNAGQRYRDRRCFGEPVRQDWEGAQAFARDFSVFSSVGWRVPTASELRSLTESGCANPVVNPQAFPGILVSNYWTSSPTWRGKQFACSVNMLNGSLFCRSVKTLEMPFLLVRDDAR